MKPTGRDPCRATPEGTASYRDAHGEMATLGHFRPSTTGLAMSSVGLGTYLGDEDDVSDALYDEAVEWTVRSGCNVIDTAINYRCQRSERIVGKSLDRLMREGLVQRDQLVIASKGGFIPFDSVVPSDPRRYTQSTYVQTGVIAQAELVAGCHCVAPSFLADQIQRSLENLRVSCIDIYYLHNPETQLQEVSQDEFSARIRSAFEFLEGQADEGVIGAYGIATWNGLRRTRRAREYLSLAELVRTAEELRGAEHRFRFVQLPYNLAMVEARTLKEQLAEGCRVDLLEAACSFGVTVVASSSILQGQFARLPTEVAEAIPGFDTDTQRAIQFVRSTQGITTALVGMKGQRHVEENLAVARVRPDPEAVERLLASAA